ncbi:MAG: SpoIIE family protein phosphatase [Oscillospiraceae bacterium]|nr:SpoIIE family protein phosphatase [Oscillospiraceae bacterium]
MKLKLLPKFIISLAVLAIVLTVVISLFSYNTSKAYLEDMYAQRVMVNSDAIAKLLYPEEVREILAPGGEETETYARLADLFNRLKKDGEITFLSLTVPDEEAVTFYIDAMVPEMGDDPANQIPYGSRILYTDAAGDENDLQNYKINWDHFVRNKNLEGPVITDNDYGYNYTGIAIVRDENGEAMAEIQYILDMRDVRAYLNSVLIRMLLISLVILVVAMMGYIVFVRNAVTLPVSKLAKFTEEITDASGITDKRSEMHTGDEIESLSNSFNYMLDELGVYIDNLSRVTAEKERIGAELSIAAQIQADMLPRIFRVFQDRREFDLFASMNPAKEVGGDFYDFFLIDDDHIGLVMADVSGKGVPAALFMVIAKTLIKNRAQMGGSPSEILRFVNEQLCDGNEAELFVTVWLAIVELSTGKGMAANAGHEHPVIRRADGKYELQIYRHSPAVATMEGLRFREHPFQLNPGDRLFVYTDGVPEATNAENELFGTERMLAALNRNPDVTPEELLHAMREEIDGFVRDAPQFDDITMLSFYYIGPSEDSARELTTEAEVDRLAEVLAFVDGELEKLDCPPKAQMQLDIAVEEIFVNIAHYAYAPESGTATVRVGARSDPKRVTITFTDRGTPYDPLARADPDVTLSAEERQIGGLGIFMVKKSMDDMRYEYQDGQNILTLEKGLE